MISSLLKISQVIFSMVLVNQLNQDHLRSLLKMHVTTLDLSQKAEKRLKMHVLASHLLNQ